MTMKYIINAATKIKYKTDGVHVWWWSFTRGAWIADEDCTPDIIDSQLKTGNAYLTD